MICILLIFVTLTVSIDSEHLMLAFGPVPLIRKKYSLSEIESVSHFTYPWYYGYGIRLTPNGLLYNISGSDAIKIKFYSGKVINIGTDEPDMLLFALEKAG